MFFVSGCNGCQCCPIRSPLTVIKFLMIFMFFEFLFKIRTNGSCICCCQGCKRSFWSESIASTSNTTFWWALYTQSDSFLSQPARTHHLSLRVQNFENPIFTFGCFSLKAVYNSCKLERLLQSFYLCIYFSIHTNIVFLSRHLPTEIVIFINASYQMKCFIGDSFSFFENRFCEYSSYFFDFTCISYKVFKCIKIFWIVLSRPFIR